MNGPDMKILIVDDDYAYRKLLTTILIGLNHEVVEAENGSDAWQMIQESPYAFIITDWMMPEMSGVELVKRIRSAEFPHYIYIIMLTARSTRDDIIEGLEAGIDDYLTKPFDLDELRARIAIGVRIVHLESRLRSTLAQLEILATYDSLTNLYNRRALYDSIRTEWNRASRANKPISLIMLDIDHFKQINDHYGHLVGDEAIRHVAQTLNQHKRSYDIIGRWGGEEFLLILPGTDLYEAACVAERLRKALGSSPLREEGGQLLVIRASFGVSGGSAHEPGSFDKYIQQADRALYRAKNTGRNQVCTSDECEHNC
jgi:two-component system chemotaxis response regulator CheY